jgi:hypothetical protein
MSSVISKKSEFQGVRTVCRDLIPEAKHEFKVKVRPWQGNIQVEKGRQVWLAV